MVVLNHRQRAVLNEGQPEPRCSPKTTRRWPSGSWTNFEVREFDGCIYDLLPEVSEDLQQRLPVDEESEKQIAPTLVPVLESD